MHSWLVIPAIFGAKSWTRNIISWLSGKGEDHHPPDGRVGDPVTYNALPTLGYFGFLPSTAAGPPARHANMEWNIPNRPDTKFRLGSITKQFTSMLILQAVAEGKLTLEGKLADDLPYYRQDTGKKVTIHHLLTHTSGIPSYTGLPNFGAEVSRKPYGTMPNLWSWIRTTPTP